MRHSDEAVPQSDAASRPGESSRASDRASRHRAGQRGGRNLPAAILVGLGLGAVVTVPLFAARPVFLGVVALAVALGTWEMVRSVQAQHAHPPLLPLVVGGTGMVLAAWYAGAEALLVGLLMTAVAVLLWRLAAGPEHYLRDVRTGLLIAAYVPFLAGFCVLLAVPDDGARRVMTFLAAVVASDIGGYALGALIGRHPMAPTVSPKKSWEGFAGSTIACLAASGFLLTSLFHGQGSWLEGYLFGAAIVVAATLGDLGESMIKRDLSLKDMGSLLPGHGGIMDRLDSLLVAAPVAYLLLQLFIPPS